MDTTHNPSASLEFRIWMDHGQASDSWEDLGGGRLEVPVRLAWKLASTPWRRVRHPRYEPDTPVGGAMEPPYKE